MFLFSRLEIEQLKEKIRHLELSQMKHEVEQKQIQQHLLRTGDSTESSNGSLGDLGDEQPTTPMQQQARTGTDTETTRIQKPIFQR